MTPPPRLAVHVGRHERGALADVLAAAEPWCDAVAVAEQEPEPDGIVAHLYTGDVVPSRPRRPCAVWRLAGVRAPEPDGAVVLAELGTVDAAGVDLLVRRSPLPDGARLILPFTRSRYRELRDLPPHMVSDWCDGDPRWSDADGETVPAPLSSWPSLIALSAAVVATGAAVLDALAWGCPTVTDGATAHSLGLAPGQHVLVHDDVGERRRLADRLAGDEALGSTLGRQGWALVRRRRPEDVAEELCRRLGFGPRRDVVAPARLSVALDALGTPSGALVRRRAWNAVAPLPGAVTHGRHHTAERTEHVES